MANLGFKELTRENWLETDEVNKAFVIVDKSGARSFAADDWLAETLAPQLNLNAPDEIHRLFEVARGALAYGYFFHPLRALGMEQAYRVAEAALANKCQMLGMPATVTKFHDRIEWMAKNGHLTNIQKQEWHEVREGRNVVSHPQDQLIAHPDWALMTFKVIADRINTLYP